MFFLWFIQQKMYNICFFYTRRIQHSEQIQSSVSVSLEVKCKSDNDLRRALLNMYWTNESNAPLVLSEDNLQ